MLLGWGEWKIMNKIEKKNGSMEEEHQNKEIQFMMRTVNGMNGIKKGALSISSPIGRCELLFKILGI